jgi:hypothetical protein
VVFSLSILGLALLSTPSAQDLLQAHHGQSVWEHYGHPHSFMSDMDGDGVNDIL